MFLVSDGYVWYNAFLLIHIIILYHYFEENHYSSGKFCGYLYNWYKFSAIDIIIFNTYYYKNKPVYGDFGEYIWNNLFQIMSKFIRFNLVQMKSLLWIFIHCWLIVSIILISLQYFIPHINNSDRDILDLVTLLIT